MPKNDYTINSAYNSIFRGNSIEHIELDYNGDDILGFIQDQKDLVEFLKMKLNISVRLLGETNE